MTAIALSNADLATLYLAVAWRAEDFRAQGKPEKADELKALSLKIAQMQKLGVSAAIVEVAE